MADFVAELIGSLLEAVAETSPETVDDIASVLKDIETVAADVLDTFQDLFDLIDDDGDRALYEGIVRLVRTSELGKQFDDDTIRSLLQSVLQLPDSTLLADSKRTAVQRVPTDDRDQTVSLFPPRIIAIP